MPIEKRTLARLALPVQLLAVVAWLWPIGFGGKMPVGGDVTQFSLGLMAELSRALKAGRLPLWNDLWGFGFPAIGESQMGVYYPPHWLLYGFLEPEVAYAWSLVFHTLWGSLGVYWAARKFGVSETGAALAGFAWSTCAFFVIHLSHQWGYTTGCWMPWAWGLAWSSLRSDGHPRDAFLLAIVLCLQLLPGHFQLAFTTEVGVVLLTLSQLGDRSRLLMGMGRVVLALGSAFLLAAMQLWPTLRLARLASSQRDFEYLSGFAATPLHLVTFLTPGLFERSPLWRMVLWDPFHTSPEEYLGYIGLVPLFLAMGAVVTGWRQSGGVRALFSVALVTLLFALGPYVPGFQLLISLPGFSFFRAPARWMLAVSLSLCLLSGIGFDGLATWRKPGKALVTFAFGGFATVLLVLLAIELALFCTGRPGLPTIASLYAKAFDALPWRESSVFERTVDEARRPFQDRRVYQTWARQGVLLRDAPRPVFAEQRLAIYREELTGSLFLMAALIVIAPLARRGRALPGLFLVLTFVDLWSVSRNRREDLGPIETLASQSPVFSRLATSPRGTRTVETFGNMPMVAGAAPLSAYRTLDLPALESLTILMNKPVGPSISRSQILESLRLTGADIRIFAPGEEAEPIVQGPTESIRDPALAGWLLGKDFVAQKGARADTFSLWKIPGPRARGWLVPFTPERSAAIGGVWSGELSTVVEALRDATPLDVRSLDPELRTIAIHAKGPSIVVLSQLADPQWEATLETDGMRRKAEPFPAFRSRDGGAWQAIKIPEAGDWTLTMRYNGRDVYQGLGISLIAWITLAAIFVRYGREQRGEST